MRINLATLVQANIHINITQFGHGPPIVRPDDGHVFEGKSEMPDHPYQKHTS